MVNQWFRFSMGRMETTNDACSIQGIRDAFRASGGNIRELLARIALSPAFRNVRLTGELTIMARRLTIRRVTRGGCCRAWAWAPPPAR